jgi:hypothetical protein
MIPNSKESLQYLINEDTNLIEAIEIDHVSDQINKKMNTLLEQELKLEEDTIE